MHVAVVLAKDVMNAIQKVSPEAGRAGQIHSSPTSPVKKVIWVELPKLAHYIGQKDFLPVRINLLTETSHEQIPCCATTMMKVLMVFYASVAISALVVEDGLRVIQGSQN